MSTKKELVIVYAVGLRMRDWIFNIWQLLKVCLGFVPAFMMLCASIIFFVLFGLEHYYVADTGGYSLYNDDLGHAQDLMNTLLQTTVTMATLVITMTMLVVSLAATQLGPRLIKNFISNRTTHQYMGFFFCAVLLCAEMVVILHHDALSDPLPRLTISFVMVYSVLSFCMLLGFVNHVARSCIADNVIHRVYRHLQGLIKRMAVEEDELSRKALPKSFEKNAKTYGAARDGFIQSINFSELTKFAKSKDIQIKIVHCAGDYVVQGQDAFQISGKKDLEESDINHICAQIIIGDERTPTQDVEYAFRHLTETGLRALSPGINDHVTARLALNYITAGLVELSRRTLHNGIYEDAEGACRVQGKVKCVHELLKPGILPILEAGRDKSDILEHVLEKVRVLEHCAQGKALQDEIKDIRAITKELIDVNFKSYPHLKAELKI